MQKRQSRNSSQRNTGHKLDGFALVVILIAACHSLAGPASLERLSPPTPLIQCAQIEITADRTKSCFNDRFLDRLSAVTRFKIDSHLHRTRLDGNEIFQYPFAVLTGEGAFDLSPKESRHFKSYLSQGGFLLISAQCANKQWSARVKNAVMKSVPEARFERLAADHPLMRMVYKIGRIGAVDSQKRHRPAVLEALRLHKRIVAIVSSDGLNDFSNLPGCSCSSGFEIENAQFINVNILAFALTH